MYKYLLCVYTFKSLTISIYRMVIKRDIVGLKADLKFGSANEMYVKEILTDLHPDHHVLFHEKKFSIFDYKVLDNHGDIIHQYELKSRRINSNTYPTLMFGENKLRYVEEEYEKRGGNFTFLWYCSFDEVLMAWDWKKGTKEFTLGKGQNKVRREKAKACVYIKTADMYQIEYVL